VSTYVLSKQEYFHLKLLHSFKDIAVFVVGSFSLLHPVDTHAGPTLSTVSTQHSNLFSVTCYSLCSMTFHDCVMYSSVSLVKQQI